MAVLAFAETRFCVVYVLSFCDRCDLITALQDLRWQAIWRLKLGVSSVEAIEHMHKMCSGRTMNNSRSPLFYYTVRSCLGLSENREYHMVILGSMIPNRGILLEFPVLSGFQFVGLVHCLVATPAGTKPERNPGIPSAGLQSWCTNIEDF